VYLVEVKSDILELIRIIFAVINRFSNNFSCNVSYLRDNWF
jgi:hypothetical protein